MEPSRFYRQHHAVEAPVIDDREYRPGWRVLTKCDQLLIEESITYAEWKAAQIFRALAMRVLASAYRTKWIGEQPRGGNGSFDRALAARGDAINRLHDLSLALGGFAIDLLEAHVVNDEDWKELGRYYGVQPRTAKAWVVVTLKALAAVMYR